MSTDTAELRQDVIEKAAEIGDKLATSVGPPPAVLTGAATPHESYGVVVDVPDRELLLRIDQRLAAIEAYVEVATPLVAELAETMPKLRQIAVIGEQLSQGGLGGIMAAMRGGQ